MAFGISTSCLYPLETEKSLDTLGKIGVKTCEVFLNSPSETTLEFAKTLNKIRKEYGIKIASVHPFSSFAETYMLFSAYGRRFNDMLEFYKRNFEVTAALGAEFSVIHGVLTGAKISDTEYFERFAKLIEEGKKSGIKVCHENVNRHLCESPVFIEKMKNYLGDGFKLVFDDIAVGNILAFLHAQNKRFDFIFFVKASCEAVSGEIGSQNNGQK
ncbi:MAG: TIM barrel protein, partial [Clostridia bacterium]|nr:TIM barrel protein [Clostridia bacterium]